MVVEREYHNNTNVSNGSRVAIIGGGPSAISTLIAFVKAQDEGEQIPEIVCFEKQNSIGGQWIYNWRTTVDEYGVPVSNSMYRDLRVNAPKEADELYDYTFDEHFGDKPVNSYCSRQEMLEYFQGRAAKFGIEKFVKFRTLVRNVKEIGDHGKKKFFVQYEDLPTANIFEEIFDYVIVACGMNSTPNLPRTYPGLDTFPGRISHAHELRQSKELSSVNKLLIIGTGFSAIDIARFHHSLCKNDNERLTILSHRKENPTLSLNWPKSVINVGDLERVCGNVCYFKDGSKHENIDMIMFATGYKFDFRFLENSELRLKGGSSLVYKSLYKSTFHQANSKLLYIGMIKPLFSFPMYDRQAWLVKEVLLGKKGLPSVDERQKDIDSWMKRLKDMPNGCTAKDAICIYPFVIDHTNDLVKVNKFCVLL